MPLLTKVAGLVVVATVALQWLDTQPNLDDVAGGAFAPWLHASRVTRFYQQHAPDKIAGVPGVLESYRGREDVLYSKLARKYGVDDSRTTWRVDALAAGRAAVEAAAHAVSRSPAAAEVITRWRAAAPGEKATRAAFAAALLAYLSAAAPRDRVRSLCYLGPAAVALVYGPSPAAFSLRSVVDATVETVRRNDVRGRLVGIGAATAFAATLRPRAGPVLAVGTVAAALATNPGMDTSGVVDAGLLRAAGLATRRDAAKVVEMAPGQLRVHDFSLLSAVAYAPTDTWGAPVLAVGAFGRWCPLASIRVRGEVVEVEASTFPLYLVAAGLAGLAWLGLSYFDAAPSVTL